MEVKCVHVKLRVCVNANWLKGGVTMGGCMYVRGRSYIKFTPSLLFSKGHELLVFSDTVGTVI